MATEEQPKNNRRTALPCAYRLPRLCLAFLLLSIFNFQFSIIHAQTVSGTVTDARTGETLIGATILETASGRGTVTNAHGRYTLTPGVASAQLRISYIGYKTQHHTLDLASNPTLNLRLEPAVELDEVTITAERVTAPTMSQMSAIEVPVEQIKLVPVIFGEADVLKAIQLLPGVQSGTEGTSGIYVRGGGPDENLFLLDGIPLYNVNHLGGFFSAFNSDAIKNVTLYKGSFPARFSGRISSVLDITTNNGNDREWHGSASLGAIAAKFSIEGPIIKERTTLSLSLRRTYFDLLLQPFLMAAAANSGEGSFNAGYYFYDLNAKLTHRFNDRSRLYASLYSGDDAVYLRARTRNSGYSSYSYEEYMRLRYGWGNIAASVRWNYVLSPRLFLNVTGAYTRYRNRLTLGFEEEFRTDEGNGSGEAEMSYNSGIHDFILRADLDYQPTPDHTVKFGAHITHHRFTPEVAGYKIHAQESDGYRENIDTTVGESRVRAQEFTLYAEDDWAVSEALKVNAGLSLSGFLVSGKFYPSLQPRLSGRFMLSDDLSLKAGYAYMTQYLHLLSTSNISLPTDLWVPVTRRIPPMGSHQVAAGLFYSRWGIDFSVEAYYKWMHNLMEYLPGSSFFGSSTGWEDKVCLGDGRAYGLELLAQKSFGDITGWIGYTLSRTLRTFPQLNNGREFPAKYDRIHDIAITLQYRPNPRFDCGITWVFATGNTATLALQEYEGEVQDRWQPGSITTSDYGYIESRNNFRLPVYHRLDFSVNFHKKKKHGTRTWNISVYNAYNHQNPFIIYRAQLDRYTSSGLRSSVVLRQLSLFPILPSVSYIYKF
ncbi:MAG: carboxypeptidase-like regulatory domain-containing protein [Bacteroidales bacterium]|nr:carboxypeptidase-like regulatory domain-containing protein [Bacteroidales bacterium]